MKKTTSAKQTQPKATFKKKTSTGNIKDRSLGYFHREHNSVTTIYLGNLSYKKDQDDIKKMFSQFGKVSFVRQIIDKKTNLKKGTAFIQMTNKEEAIAAIASINGKIEDGRTLKCSIAIDTPQQARKPKKFTEKVVPEKEDIEMPPRRRDKKKGLNLLFANTGRK